MASYQEESFGCAENLKYNTVCKQNGAVYQKIVEVLLYRVSLNTTF